MDNPIQHDPKTLRFNTVVDDVTGYVEYELAEEVMTLTHTIVPSAIGGRGIAGALVKASLDHARAQGWKVVPQCSYADTWMRRHPDYEGLRA
ncbi:GNAT family N-acetyltransferase [Thermomonas sp.]|uniref:GNAT family N-acetyltransferase n=1 Tax=Thermomonas sp. TaxID=1971895 RepID=UPI002488A863|nr:GNAT family N-acetyltransferase [Thermomonas sp.]MDI1253588.1 GNAT family N-acetyltransferase [Thermomonas sp.]